jgi:cardiolipin synthase
MRPEKKRKSQAYTTCNKVQLIRGGKEYFKLLLLLIDQAVESIHLQTYIFEDDETGRLVADALKAAAKRKVKVYLLLDGYASQPLPDVFIEELKNAGINFRFFQPLLKSRHFYFGRRLHHKIFVADSKFAITGSKNISNRYNDMPGVPSWLDFTVYLEGEVARELCILCAKIWKGYSMQKNTISCGSPLTGDEANGSTIVRVRRNDWLQKKNQVSATYIEMLRTAHSHVTILSSYFLPGKIIRNRLKAAAKRGVKIKVIVAGKSDVMISKNAERWLYDWLLRNKIEVYEYEPAILHAKTVVCDTKWCTIGSYNINNISAYTSVELNVDILDENFTAEVENTLHDIIRNESVLITDEKNRLAKNIFKQFIRWASYQAIRTMYYLVTFYYRRG